MQPLADHLPRPAWAGDDKPFIRLSHSTMENIRTCERKFQIQKLLTIQSPRMESEHFSFGHGYGTFVATYLLTGGALDFALLEGWLDYFPIIETDKKNQVTCYDLCLRSVPALDDLLANYDIATFNDIPAVELSFRIDIDHTFYYVGYVDVVLQHKVTKQFLLIDAKTTGLTLIDMNPLFKFSPQLLSYSVILDDIAEAQGVHMPDTYEVLYLLGALGRNPMEESTTCKPLFFKKTLVDRLQWFLTLKQDIEALHLCINNNNFPHRPAGCMKFNKVCPEYGACGLTTHDKYKEHEVDIINYQFTMTLNNLIASHLERLDL